MSTKNIHEKVPIDSVLVVKATGNLQDEVEKELETPTPPKDIAQACILENSNENTKKHE